jgi:hypothetical protein
MKVLKKFGEFFKKKPTQNLDQYDVEEIEFMMSEFLKDFIMNNDLSKENFGIEKELEPSLITFYIMIYSELIFFFNREIIEKIINSEDFKDLRFRIKQSYNLYDTSDEIAKYKKKSGGPDLSPDYSLELIYQTPVIQFKITPK